MSTSTSKEKIQQGKDKINGKANSNITPAGIKAEAESKAQETKKADENKCLFLVKSANRWLEEANKRPVPQMLFDEFWFEGELCILFADTNQGKSIKGVQIGDSISQGKPITGFRMEAVKQPVLYFDFELSDKQFENRYSQNFQHHYKFDENFIRVEINPDADIPDGQTFEDLLNYSLERTIVETGAKVLIIDNLTYLRSEMEKAKDALPLMKHLKALKSKYGLSILALAHTPKRDSLKPITRNDLQGSKMLINFCDSSFSIGESSSDKNLRYLKQIKVRQNEFLFDAGNVCVCQINKPFNFLQFDFIKYGFEQQHLKQYSEKETENQSAAAIQMDKDGQSLREIARKLGCSHTQVKRILDNCNTGTM